MMVDITPKQALQSLLGYCDFGRGCCRLMAPVAAAIPEEALTNAREVANKTPDDAHSRMVLTVLDQIDYTKCACGPFDTVGACMPREVLDKARSMADE